MFPQFGEGQHVLVFKAHKVGLFDLPRRWEVYSESLSRSSSFLGYLQNPEKNHYIW